MAKKINGIYLHYSVLGYVLLPKFSAETHMGTELLLNQKSQRFENVLFAHLMKCMETKF